MLQPFTHEERYLLAMEIPSLALPAIEAPTDIDLHERAHEIGYPDEVTPRGQLLAYYKILGVVPSSFEERLQLTGARP